MKTKLENILASARTVEGQILWIVYDPKTNQPSYYPVPSVPRGLRTTREGTRVLGKLRQKDFEKFWVFEYNEEFGELDPKDVTQQNHYESKPDYYNATLDVFIEVKDHKLSQTLLKTFYNSIVWLSKKSMDGKVKHQRANPTSLFVIAVFFVDKGWYSVPLKKVLECDYYPSTYGDLVYYVPLEVFEKIEYMIERRANELSL